MKQNSEEKSFFAQCLTKLCCCCCKDDEQSYQPVDADVEAQELDGVPPQPGTKKVAKKGDSKQAEGAHRGSGNTPTGFYLLAAVHGGEKIATGAGNPVAAAPADASSSKKSDLDSNPLFQKKQLSAQKK